MVCYKIFQWFFILNKQKDLNYGGPYRYVRDVVFVYIINANSHLKKDSMHKLSAAACGQHTVTPPSLYYLFSLLLLSGSLFISHKWLNLVKVNILNINFY